MGRRRQSASIFFVDYVDVADTRVYVFVHVCLRAVYRLGYM